MLANSPPREGRHQSTVREVPAATLQHAGWAVFISLFGLILAWIFGIGFLLRGGIYAPLSDLSSLLYNLPLLVVAWVLYLIYRPTARAASRGVLAVGVLGVVLSGASGIGLTVIDLGLWTGPADLFLAGQRVGGLVTGMWLVSVSVQELRQESFARRVALAGIAGGFGLVVLDVSLLIGGEGHPGFGLGSIIQLLGTVLWSVWIGRRLLASEVELPSESRSNSTVGN